MRPFVFLEKSADDFVLVCSGCGHCERVVTELAYQPQAMLMRREHLVCAAGHEPPDHA
jgi:hypothetical protein